MRWSKRNLRPGICSSKAPFCSHQLVISPTHQQVGLQKGDSQVSPRKKSRSSIINLNKFVIFSRDTKIKNGGNQTWKELKWVLSLSTYKLATFLLFLWYLTWHTIWSIQNKISPGPINPAKPHQKKFAPQRPRHPWPCVCALRVGQRTCSGLEKTVWGFMVTKWCCKWTLQMVMVIVIVMMMTMKILERIKHMTKIVAMKMILLIHDKNVYIYIYTRGIFSTRTAYEFLDNYLWQYMIRIMILTMTMNQVAVDEDQQGKKRKHMNKLIMIIVM